MPKIPHNKKPPSTTADVLVIGGGMAGLIAAIEASTAGVSVILIDKLRSMAQEKVVPVKPGGAGNDTARAGGGGLARFENQAPVEEMLERHMEKSWGKADRELIRTYLDRVARDCCWLRDEVKLPFTNRNRVYGLGPGLARFLIKEAKRRAVTSYFETKALKLLTDDDDRVAGVITKGLNGKMEFHGKVVILATGSFQGNQEMLIKYVGPEMTYGTTLTGCPTNTGDGHQMAMKLGAKMINLSSCHVRTMDGECGWGPSRELENIYPRGIYLNMEFQRFLDEGTADSDTIGSAIVYQPQHKAMLIFDEKIRSSFPEEWKRVQHNGNIVRVAQSLEDLANKIGLDPARFMEAVGDFNNAVAQGRAHLLAIPKTKYAFKIEVPPFYGFYPVLPGLNHPLGGLKINPKCQVMNLEDTPINGLYAAGSLVNWSFGRPYRIGNVTSYKGSYHAAMSSGLATALTFGRIAGQNAAAEAKKEGN